MAAKNKDPFNFDDIYKQAGMGGFVKKSMAEQKASATAAPRPASMASSPAPKPAVANGSMGAAPRPMATSPSPRAGAGASLGSHSNSASSLVGMEDPFASLGVSNKASQPMKAAVRSASPANVPAAKRPADSPHAAAAAAAVWSGAPGADSTSAAASGTPHPAPTGTAAASTFDLDDMFGLSGQRPAASTAAAASNAEPRARGGGADDDADPFAAFETVEGAAPAVAAPAVSAAQPDDALTFDDDFGFPAATSSPSAPVQPRSPQPASPAAAVTSPPQPAPKAATTYFAMYEDRHQSPRPGDDSFQEPSSRQPRHSDEDRFARASSYESRHATSSSYSRYGDGGSDGGSSAREAEHQQHSSHGSSKTVFGGLLKGAAAWGKKGLKAAQAGLQQLESALEGIDGKGTGGNGSPRLGSGRHHYGDGQEGGPEEDVPAEQVLQIAIHVSELPSRQQEEKLARLPRSMRMKVQAILREQAVLEGEESISPTIAATMAPRVNSRVDAGAGVVDIQTQEFDLDAAAAGGDSSPPRRAPPAAATAAVTAAAIQQRQAHQAAARQPPPAAPAPAEEDLLGVDDSSAPAPAAAKRPPAPTAPAPAARPAAASERPVAAAAHAEEDLLGLSGRSAAPAASQQRAPPVQDVADVDDFFSGGSSTAAKPATANGAVHTSSSAGQLGDLLGRGSTNTSSSSTASRPAARPAGARPPKANSMIDLGGLDALHSNVDVSGHSALYGGVEGEEGEPELRRQLRAAREADKHAKMKQALAEKLAKEEEEAKRRQGQQDFKQVHRERIDTWKNKNKGNVRGLLGSLQTVLWEDSGWKPIGMGDLLEPAQVRKAWMKANLLVHPDKVRQRQDSDERVAIADMIFDALKQAMENLR